MRVSDWSSDVCSSDLPLVAVADEAVVERGVDIRRFAFGHACEHAPDLLGQRRRHGTKTCGTGFDHGRVDGKTLEIRFAQVLPLDQRRAAVEGDFLERNRSEEHTSELQSLNRRQYA